MYVCMYIYTHTRVHLYTYVYIRVQVNTRKRAINYLHTIIITVVVSFVKT